MTNAWFRRRGRLARDGWESVVSWESGASRDATDGWRYTGLRIADLEAGAVQELPAGQIERLVVPLAGSFAVEHEAPGSSPVTVELTGRDGVFVGPTDTLYLGAGTAAKLRGSGRVAVAEAPTDQVRPTAYLPADRVPVEIRGAGRDTRQVHNLGTPEALDAAALIVCEVITPAGNWSSHPAHKHDEAIAGHESQLEEIYYFEAAPSRQTVALAPAGADAFGMFVTAGSPAGPIDTHATVRTGDIALVPHGYHGPAVAAPEYDLYYLNVMAGPERCWLFSDDPQQTWIRATWPEQHPDPRLPYGAVDHDSGRAEPGLPESSRGESDLRGGERR